MGGRAAQLRGATNKHAKRSLTGGFELKAGVSSGWERGNGIDSLRIVPK